jgi:hypothetical protein
MAAGGAAGPGDGDPPAVVGAGAGAGAAVATDGAVAGATWTRSRTTCGTGGAPINQHQRERRRLWSQCVREVYLCRWRLKGILPFKQSQRREFRFHSNRPRGKVSNNKKKIYQDLLTKAEKWSGHHRNSRTTHPSVWAEHPTAARRR